MATIVEFRLNESNSLLDTTEGVPASHAPIAPTTTLENDTPPLSTNGSPDKDDNSRTADSKIKPGQDEEDKEIVGQSVERVRSFQSQTEPSSPPIPFVPPSPRPRRIPRFGLGVLHKKSNNIRNSTGIIDTATPTPTTSANNAATIPNTIATTPVIETPPTNTVSDPASNSNDENDGEISVVEPKPETPQEEEEEEEKPDGEIDESMEVDALVPELDPPGLVKPPRSPRSQQRPRLGKEPLPTKDSNNSVVIDTSIPAEAVANFSMYTPSAPSTRSPIGTVEVQETEHGLEATAACVACTDSTTTPTVPDSTCFETDVFRKQHNDTKNKSTSNNSVATNSTAPESVGNDSNKSNTIHKSNHARETNEEGVSVGIEVDENSYAEDHDDKEKSNNGSRLRLLRNISQWYQYKKKSKTIGTSKHGKNNEDGERGRDQEAIQQQEIKEQEEEDDVFIPQFTQHDYALHSTDHGTVEIAECSIASADTASILNSLASSTYVRKRRETEGCNQNSCCESSGWSLDPLLWTNAKRTSQKKRNQMRSILRHKRKGGTTSRREQQMSASPPPLQYILAQGGLSFDNDYDCAVDCGGEGSRDPFFLLDKYDADDEEYADNWYYDNQNADRVLRDVMGEVMLLTQEKMT
ncbi:hypothetical protein ACA910_006421 [Epithemia clementina (nom. ined.)]